jgi:MATE family multidrug resistance protein
MWVNTLATAVNLVLDYALIFGSWGFPELGIKGAAIATVMAGFFSFFTFLVLLALGRHNALYHTFKGWRPDKDLFSRLLKFGFPSGLQFFLEMAGFTGFVLLVGRLGTTSLAATNIAFNISTLAFLPMIGTGMAISILVGQYLGADKPDFAQKSVYSGFHLTFVYMGSIALAYIMIPEIFVAPFAAQADPQQLSDILRVSIILLRFVAIYSIFDTMNIVFSFAIKGAGDTRFPMYVSVFFGFFVLVCPAYIAIVVFGMGLMFSWAIATFYVVSLGFVFYFRFLGGKWKSMRVIETALAA